MRFSGMILAPSPPHHGQLLKHRDIAWDNLAFHQVPVSPSHTGWHHIHVIIV